MHLSTTLSIRPRAAAPGKAPAADILVDGDTIAAVGPLPPYLSSAVR